MFDEGLTSEPFVHPWSAPDPVLVIAVLSAPSVSSRQSPGNSTQLGQSAKIWIWNFYLFTLW